jgi:teichuronic acid exporter
VTMRTTAQIVNWLITIVVVRLLTPSDYGLIGLAQILIGFCLMVNQLGAVPAIIQQREVTPVVLRQTFALVLLSNAVLYLILFAGAPWFSQFYGEPRLIVITRVLALGLLIGAFSAVPYALLQREMNFKWMSLIEFGASGFGALTTLVLVIAGNGVWGLVIGNLATASCISVGLLVQTRFWLLPQFHFAGFGQTLSFGLKVSGSNLLWYLNRNTPGLIIGKALGSTDLGYYTIMFDFAMLPIAKIMGLTNQIALTAYSRIQDDLTLVRYYFFESSQIMLLVIFPITWGMAAVAGDLIAVVLGLQWLPATVVLQVIALGAPLRTLDLIMGTVVTGLGRPDLILRNTLTATLIIPIAAISGLAWGLVGLCITSLFGSILASVIIMRRNSTVMEVGIGQMLLLYFPPAVSAGVMYVAVAAAEATLLDQMPILWRLGSAVMLGAAVYGLMTMLVNRYTVLRVLKLIAMQRPGRAIKREINAASG